MKMKRTLILLSFFAASAEAQTITLGPITKLSYCVGDTLWVPYQASGTFSSANFFTVQLSDPSGSFGSFTNVGHSNAGSGVIPVPLVTKGQFFQVRVASTDPYEFSSANGVNISV